MNMLKCQKHLFQLDKDIHYLNCAYKAPLLKSAENALIDSLEKERNPYHYKPNDFFEITEDICKSFSQIIECRAQNIALFPSTSYGFASALNNIKSHGGKAITIENEFPSGYFALEKWAISNNAEIIVIKREDKSAQNWNNLILDSIDDSTDVVLLSIIHWMNGTKLNIKEIGEKCRKHNAKLIADGTQIVGAAPINVNKLNIDILICAAYKWLFGPYSMAVGYFSDDFHQGNPIEESWMNRSNAMNFSSITEYDINYKPGSARYNVGQTSNFMLSPILLEGLNQINQWGTSNIQAYCQMLANYLKESLIPMGVEFENEKYFYPHLFSLKLPNDINPEIVKNQLENKNIYVSLRGSYVRVSINVFNQKENLDALINCCHQLLG